MNTELFDFIMAQPDDRTVNMREANGEQAKCGCVLVQFGRKKFKRKIGKCGYGSFDVIKHKNRTETISLDTTTHDLIWDLCGRFETPTTYKKIKAHVMKHLDVYCPVPEVKS